MPPEFLPPAFELPKSVGVKPLTNLLKLNQITLHEIELDGLAYVGYSFNAVWEPELGLGVLTHGDRVVELGGADTSFLRWVAERAANRDKRKAKAR